MDGVRYHPSWPGLSGREGHVIHSAEGLAAVVRALTEEAGALNRPANLGSMPHFHRRAGAFAPLEIPTLHFGDWRTAGRLSSAHYSAVGHSLAVYAAVLRNIAEFCDRLRTTSENYQRAELNIIAAIASHGSAVRAGQLIMVSLPHPPQATGALEISRQRPYPETAEEYDPEQIAQWLRLLREGEAWNAHYAMGRSWRATAEAVQGLCAVLFRQAREIHVAWQDRASPLAQQTLRRIEGTTQGLAGLAWTLVPLAGYVAQALEETLAELRLGTSIGWHPNGRRARIKEAFDQLNGRYREIIGAYPSSLAFDLPFGGMPASRSESVLPGRSADPVSAPPSTAADPVQAPPVIGGEMPQSWSFDLRGRHWLDELDSSGPGLVG